MPQYAHLRCTFAWCQWLYNILEANDVGFYLVEKANFCLLIRVSSSFDSVITLSRRHHLLAS